MSTLSAWPLTIKLPLATWRPHAGRGEEMPTVSYYVASYSNLNLTRSPAACVAGGTPTLPLAENTWHACRFLLIFPLGSVPADRAAVVYNAGDGAVFLLTSVYEL